MDKKLAKITIILLFFTILVSSDLIINQESSESDSSSKNSGQNIGFVQTIEVAKRFLQTTPITSGTGITLKTSSITKFSGLVIYQQLPLNWTVGQIFLIKGKLATAAGTSGTYVSFSFINTLSSTQKYPFTLLVSAGQTEWTLSIDTKSIAVGDYYLAFYSGLSGSYSTSTVYKLRSPGIENNIVGAPTTPAGCSLDLVDNKLVLKWNEDSKTPIEKITFTQTGKTPVQYILSNFQSTFTVKHRDFVNFGPGSVTVTVSSAYSSLYSVSGRISQYSLPWTFTFKAGYHRFSEVKTGITFLPIIPWKVAIGTVLTLKGTTSVSVDNVMVTEQPQSIIGKYPLTSSTSQYLAIGTNFSKSITLNKTGAYILEINANTGSAIINRPVYVGDALPLLPDFADLTPQLSNAAVIAAQPQTLDGLRNSLLTLINQKRAAWGKASLVFETALNSLAQGHSNDMVARNFFGHVNPNGDGPQQRASKAGITYGIGQNVANNLDLVDGHERLCRSPGHLANIVNGNYTRIGLGIAKNSQGQLYITQNFAGASTTTTAATNTTATTTTNTTNTTTTTTVSSADIESARVQVRDWMLANYLTILEDPTLTNIIKTWQTLNTTQSVFDYTWYVANYPSDYLSSLTYSASYSTTYTLKFTKGQFFAPPDVAYGKFGIAGSALSNGNVQVRVVFAK